ncbi:MAG TPA: SLC13 family permease [Terrimicrobium sp.]
MEIILVLSLLVLAIILLATEMLSIEVITLLLLSTLVLTGVLSPSEAFAGFSSEIIIILGSIFVISGGLRETGVLDVAGRMVFQLAGGRSRRLLVLIMGAASALSAFMNNTTVTAMLLPAVSGVARRAQVSPSKLLMPLAYASMLGGTCTLIGTSTNVAVSGYITHSGLKPLGLFEIAPIGLIICAIGIAYMFLIGQRLLPDHREESLSTDYGIREYLCEVTVLPHSPLVGEKSVEWDLSPLDFRILKILRGEKEYLPASDVRLQSGDTLLIEGKVENLIKIKTIEGLAIKSESPPDDRELQSGAFRLAEVLITPQSHLAGWTLGRAGFQQRYGMTVIAIHHHGRALREQLAEVALRVGDLLLVGGPEERLQALRHHPGLAVIGEHRPPVHRERQGLYTVLCFGAAIIGGGFGWLPLSIAFLLAALATVLLRGITIERAYEFIEWRLLILIAGMTAFGAAMEKTGAATLLGQWAVAALGPLGTFGILAGFFILTILLTQPLSNAAAALVVLPVALSAARALGVNERTFAIAIMLAASISFIAPFEPACILVYGPGKYRFFDFVKTGLGLTLILSVVVLLLIPLFWPLR